MIEIRVSYAVLTVDKTAMRKVLRNAGKEIIQIARDAIKSSDGADGSAPKNKTGALASDMSASVKGNTLTVSDNAEDNGNFYALFLSKGAKASRRYTNNKRGITLNKNWEIKPHPFLEPASESIEGDLGERLVNAVLNGIELKTTKS